MGWIDVPGYPPKSSCGKNWGKSPSLVEGVPASITFPYPAKKAGKEVKAWALDEKGQRKELMTVSADVNGNAIVQIGPQWKTLWYEVIGIDTDINHDGSIDINDLIIAAKDFGKISDVDIRNSDVNKDGVIDIYDIIYIATKF
jgi:hypothetical protein